MSYLGFHYDNELPIKKGDNIKLPKGTLYRHRGELREVKRATTVKVHHILPGLSMCVGYFSPLFGKMYWNYLNRSDHSRLMDLYGLNYKLEELWPIMRVDECGNVFIPLSNPEIVWAGSGGYWSDADINQFV